MYAYCMKYATGCMVGLLLLSAAHAQVVANPDTLNFEHRQDTQTIELTHNGQPVPASAIGTVQLRVDEHTYTHMISVERRDGALVVTPDSIEKGWYTLAIQTNMGSASAIVYALMDLIPDTLEAQASALGISVDELSERLGLTAASRHETVDITLPPVYYEGQTITVTAPPDGNAVHVWTVNGEVVEEGRDANRLSYTPDAAGDIVLTYVKKVDDAIVASDSATTRVIPQPPITRTVSANTRIMFHGPEGHDAYTWKLDGMPAGDGRAFEHTFAETGAHVLVNEARGPGERFRRITYNLMVE